MELHERYSEKNINWFQWIFSQIDFKKVNRLLELGCGNGRLWKQLSFDLRHREIYLSDLSKGMVEDTKRNLNNSDFSYLVIDCHQIPFKNDFFDAIVANHMLFYLKDLHQGLNEIHRVIEKDGYFYCTTYSSKHMQELTRLVLQFDPNIRLSNQSLYEIFGLENGKCILKEYFEEVEMKIFNDRLVVDEAMPLINYILSCHGNQNEIIGRRLDEFKTYVNEKVNKDNPFTITKEAGIFICHKKIIK